MSVHKYWCTNAIVKIYVNAVQLCTYLYSNRGRTTKQVSFLNLFFVAIKSSIGVAKGWMERNQRVLKFIED
jgi:hypothetical protein